MGYPSASERHPAVLNGDTIIGVVTKATGTVQTVEVKDDSWPHSTTVKLQAGKSQNNYEITIDSRYSFRSSDGPLTNIKQDKYISKIEIGMNGGTLRVGLYKDEQGRLAAFVGNKELVDNDRDVAQIVAGLVAETAKTLKLQQNPHATTASDLTGGRDKPPPEWMKSVIEGVLERNRPKDAKPKVP